MQLLILPLGLGALTLVEGFHHRRTGLGPHKSFGGSIPRTTSITACPAIWTTISNDLHNQFLTDGQCNDMARGAIRAAFHDCCAWDSSLGLTGGCDGSIILSGEVYRSENNGLVPAVEFLQNLHGNSYPSVGVADFVQFAAAVAVVTCPSGPVIQIGIGRDDSSNLPPTGLLPVGHGEGSDAQTILTLFENKGFDAVELAALLGAHSCSKQRFEDPSQAGLPQDTTPGIWDVEYYGQTLVDTIKDESGSDLLGYLSPAAPAGTTPAKVFTFEADFNLANDNSTAVASAFRSFVDNGPGWGAAYAAAHTHMSLLGVPHPETLIDCTSALPAFVSVDKRARRFRK